MNPPTGWETAAKYGLIQQYSGQTVDFWDNFPGATALGIEAIVAPDPGPHDAIGVAVNQECQTATIADDTGAFFQACEGIGTLNLAGGPDAAHVDQEGFDGNVLAQFNSILSGDPIADYYWGTAESCFGSFDLTSIFERAANQHYMIQNGGLPAGHLDFPSDIVLHPERYVIDWMGGAPALRSWQLSFECNGTPNTASAVLVDLTRSWVNPGGPYSTAAGAIVPPTEYWTAPTWQAQTQLATLFPTVAGVTTTVDLLTLYGTADWRACTDPSLGGKGGMVIGVCSDAFLVESTPDIPLTLTGSTFPFAIEAHVSVSLQIAFTVPPFRIGHIGGGAMPSLNVTGFHGSAGPQFFGYGPRAQTSAGRNAPTLRVTETT